MSEEKISSYKKLVVWQKSMTLVVNIYEATNKFPASERFGLISQMQRASISIPSNIAEGSERNTKKDFAQFIHIALGSTSELETQIDIAFRLKFINSEKYSELEKQVIEIKKMLVSLKLSLVR
ncbi:four helix bundle protein [Patescibacteria group bacterium]|nr:MAG: four helix bundle protein [Patescibacteria group bacterium]